MRHVPCRASCPRLFFFATICLALAPAPSDCADEPPVAVYPTTRTFRLSLAFDRRTLQEAMDSISKQIGLPIRFEAQDLLQEGITRNQSFGLDESNVLVEDLLRKCLNKCSLDGKLAFVLRHEKNGDKAIYVVSQQGAARRNETTFPEVRLSVRLTSRTYKLPISFDRDSLHGAIHRIAQEIGVPFEIEADDLRAIGFAPGQSHGLQETELTVEALLRKYLLRCNPDDRLAYVVRKDSAGKQTVVVVTREGAAKRGETLFAEFDLGTLRSIREVERVDEAWSNCVRAVTLEREVFRQVALLGEALKTATPERASCIAVAELAALFRIIEQYDGEVHGKRDARAMWESLGRNLPPRKAWDEPRRRRVVALYDDLRNWIASEKWLRVDEASQPIGAAQASPRPELMLRLQNAVDGRLKRGDVSTTDAAVPYDDVRHEAEIVGLIARTIRHSSYEFSDDRDYVGFAKALERQAAAIAGAAAKNDRAQIRIELERLRMRCDDCHGGFR